MWCAMINDGRAGNIRTERDGNCILAMGMIWSMKYGLWTWIMVATEQVFMSIKEEIYCSLVLLNMFRNGQWIWNGYTTIRNRICGLSHLRSNVFLSATEWGQRDEDEELYQKQQVTRTVTNILNSQMKKIWYTRMRSQPSSYPQNRVAGPPSNSTNSQSIQFQ